jgi:hypothetical protein
MTGSPAATIAAGENGSRKWRDMRVMFGHARLSSTGSAFVLATFKSHLYRVKPQFLEADISVTKTLHPSFSRWIES